MTLTSCLWGEDVLVEGVPQLTQGISVELNLLEISQEVALPNTGFTTALEAPLPAGFHLPEPKTLAPP